MENEEIWKDVLGAEGKYQVSTCGQVKSFRRKQPRLLRPCDDKDGYQHVGICYTPDDHRTRRIHQLVAEVFLPPKPTPDHELNHKDFDKTNNHWDNLEWMTQQENKTHAIERYRRGMENNQTKLSDDQVREIHRRLAAGDFVWVIAKEMGLSPSYLSMVKHGHVRKKFSPLVPHPPQRKGERSSRAILKDADIPVIRRRLRDGEKPAAIAHDYGVIAQVIYEIRSGRNWSHIPTETKTVQLLFPT